MRRDRLGSRAIAIGVVGLVGLTPVACGGGPVASAPLASSAVSAAPSVMASASAPAVPTAGASPGIVLGVDESLLQLVPDAIDGVPLEFSAEASAQVAADRALSGDADAVAYAVGVSPTSRDLLIVALARLRPGVFDDGFFRGWRDSYDEQVCSQAGGVMGHAEAEIDERQVFIGTCVNDGRTYHTWLPEERVVVSAFSVGSKRMGEQLMNALEP